MKTPGQSHKEFFKALTPEMWKNIERDVVSRLHLLQETHDSIRKSQKDPKDKKDAERVIVRLLALLGKFVSSIKQVNDLVVLDPPPPDSPEHVEWNNN